MEKDSSMFGGQRDAAAAGARLGEPLPGRPRSIGRRRFVVASLTVGPIISTLGTASTETFGKTKFPKGTACHSKSISKYASHHPGKKCPTKR
jgi:hypothetical protein